MASSSRAWLLVVQVAVAVATRNHHDDDGSSTAAASEVLSLDGGGWSLTLHSADPATRRIAAAGGKVSGPITVPGAWQAQGFGEETTQMKHQYIGAATYTRTVTVPASFAAADRSRTTWLIIERIQRSAVVHAGGAHIGDHLGQLSPFEGEVTEQVLQAIHAAQTGRNGSGGDGELALSIVVNATRREGVDGLLGEADLNVPNDGTHLGGWGGLGGHVRLESRAAAGWIVHPHVQHDLSAPGYDAATVNVSVEIGRHHSHGGGGGASAAPLALSMDVTIVDPANNTVGHARTPCVVSDNWGGPGGGSVCTSSDFNLQNPPLWSPATAMNQHTALIKLVMTTTTATAEEVLLDSTSVRFGVRKLEIIGYHWKLNGVWLYLHGYGDDSIYPMSTSPPLNHTFYKERLEFARSLGMNFVRHHSHILPTEYFDAACEVGIMVSAEFPIAYGKPKDCVSGGCDPLFKEEWSSIIQQIRNHPCVFDYTMDNEDMALDISPELRSIAKQLDPSRPVNTADGDWTQPAQETSGRNDFESAATFPLTSIPITMPNWAGSAVAGTPQLPVIVHEMGNFVSWPLLGDQIGRFVDNIKPYWLTPPLAAVTQAGLLGENALWSERSNRLYLFCWKDQLEAVRKSEKISGYEWWLLQDYWTGANGILDTYYVSKHPESELDEIRSINAAIQLLIAEPGDSLQTPPQSRLQRAYSSNETLTTSLHISNYGATTIAATSGAVISWSVVAGGGGGGGNRTVCEHNGPLPHDVPQGPGTTLVASIACPLPDLEGGSPLTLTISAMLRGENATGTVVAALASNSWRSRLYAVVRDAPSPPGRATTVYTLRKFCDYLPVADLQCSLPSLSESESGETVVPPGSVFVVDFLDSTMLEWAARGMTVIVNANGTAASSGVSNSAAAVDAAPQGPTGFVLSTDKAVFKTAWWLGSAEDTNMGTVAYPTLTDQIAPGMAPDGWADECWARLIQGGRNHLLDKAPFADAEVLLRSIDLITMVRPKAMLWQARIVSDVPPPSVAVLAKCNPADPMHAQQWSLQHAPGDGASGGLLIRHNSSGRCLSFQGPMLSGQDDVGLLPCDEATRWQYNRSGTHQLELHHGAQRRCLDVNGGTGPSVDLYTCHDPREKDYMNQQWDFVEGGGGLLRSRSPKASGGCLSLNVTVPARSGGALIVSGLNLLMNSFYNATAMDARCPSGYPYHIARGLPNSKYGVCYKSQSDAAAGSGPCDSWCANATEWLQMKAIWGDACGSLCPATSPPLPPSLPPANATHSGADVPEAAWLLHRLLEYAATSPVPAKTLELKRTECRGCFPDSFVTLCAADQ
jgi:hypothetical protein